MTELVVASEKVMRGVTRGQLTLSEGQAFTGMLDGRRRMIESEELDLRVRALEAGSQGGHKKDQGSQDQDSRDQERQGEEGVSREEHCQEDDDRQQEDRKKL